MSLFCRGMDLISYSSETVSEIDRWNRGRWNGEMKEEGRKFTPGTVVMGWQRGFFGD
jgi:hypothetical protein